MRRHRRAILYARVSKHDRAGGDKAKSVDQQIAEMQAQATREGVTVLSVLRDDGISASRYAKNKTREGWQEVTAALLAGGVDELWAWELSRMTRDRMVYAKLVGTCIATGVLLNVDGKLHDPSDPDDGFMLDMQASLAVRESGITSRRVKRDVEARAQAGKPHGKVPYGYARTYEHRSSGRILLEQVPDPTTEPVVRELVARLLRGESAYSIAADFDRRGIPSPETHRARRVHGPDAPVTPWRLETVRDLALSPTLAGQRVHNGQVIGQATWTPIISAGDHLALTTLLRGEAQRQHRPGTVRHLLSGIAECAVCGAPLRHMLNRGTPSYWCPGPDRRGRACVCRAKDKLDALVVLHVVGRLRDPELLHDLAVRREGTGAAVTAAVAELQDLRAQLAAFVQAAAEGSVSATSFATIEAGLQRKIDAAAQRVPRTGPLPAAVVDAAGPQAEQVWDSLDLDRRRQIIRALVRVVVHKSSLPKGSRRFDPSTIELIPL